MGNAVHRLPEVLRTLPRLDPNEARAFGADLEASRASLGGELPDARWPS
jgi:hypothetical protein